MLPKRNLILFFKHFVVAFVILLGILSVIYSYRYYFQPESSSASHLDERIPQKQHVQIENIDNSKHNLSEPERLNRLSTVSDKVHIFYYPWYGNPEEDSVYLHWNHEYIPNWDKQDKKIYPTGKHKPPLDIGANYFPLLGCYSSKSLATVNQHFLWIQDAGVGVLVISWYPPEQADKEGKPFDSLFPMFLDTAGKYNLKIAFHIEPYRDRNPGNFKNNVEYIIKQYGNHPAIYKLSRSSSSRALPVFYVYDSYLNTANSWSIVLSKTGKESIRNTEFDGVFLGLVVEMRHKEDMVKGGFDGFYTYFASNDFTYGSSWKNWKSLSSFAKKNHLLFVPSVGPGYIDTRVRPWNGKTTKERHKGKYYTVAWKSALLASPPLVSITSFNEWHEGTQIEPAIPKTYRDYVYEDYRPHQPEFYLNLTREYVSEFSELLTSH